MCYRIKLFGYNVTLSTHFLARYNQRNIIKDCSYDKEDVDLSIYDDSMFQEIIKHFVENTTYLCIDEKNGKKGKRDRKIGCNDGIIYGNVNFETNTINLYTFIPYKILNNNQKEKYSHLISTKENPFSGVIFNRNDKDKREDIYKVILSTNERLNNEIKKYNELKKQLHEFGANIVINIVNDMKLTFNEEMANEFGVYLINKLQEN